MDKINELLPHEKEALKYSEEYNLLWESKSRVTNNGLKSEPRVNSIEEGIELLQSYFGPLRLLIEKSNFITTFGSWNEAAIKDELRNINELIDNVNSQTDGFYKEACKWQRGELSHRDYTNKERDAFIYILLKRDFYKSYRYFPFLLSPTSDITRIYAIYILFKEHLEVLLINISKPPIVINQKVIALKHRYLSRALEGPAITVDNKDKIASDYGFFSKGSGQKLLQLYNDFHEPESRTGLFPNPQSKNSHKKRMEEVIKELEIFPGAKGIAQDEYKIFVSKNSI